MQTVSVSRQLDASCSTARDAMLDLEPFMLSAGFDEVTITGDIIDVANQVGPKRIELTLVIVDDSDAILTYEQREGIFEAMRTAYVLTEHANGTEVEATTDFALDVALIGGFLDATVIKRQRRMELDAQFDYLESATR